MARRKQPAISDELLDQLLAGADPKTAFAKDGLLDELKKPFAERALNAEIDHHLNNGEEDGRSNSRNGYGRKSVLTETAKIELEVPRDRLSTFDPQLIAKYQRRFPGFDEKIVSMYARGMSVREIQGHLRDLYGVDVSADLVSAVTDAVLEEIAEWQNRPLEPLYALVFFDAIRVKVRRRSALGGLEPTFGVAPSILSFPSRRPIFALARILGWPAGLVTDLAVHDTPLARQSSDHLPLTAKVSLAAAMTEMQLGR